MLLNDIIPKGKTGEMFQQSWGGWTLDFGNTAYLMCHTGERWNPYDSDSVLDDLLESQRAITDRPRRERILRQIARYAAADLTGGSGYATDEMRRFLRDRRRRPLRGARFPCCIREGMSRKIRSDARESRFWPDF